MTDILQEVLLDQSYERKLKFFKRTIPVVILVTSIIVIMMLINNWRSENFTQKQKQLSDILVKATIISDKKIVEDTLTSLIKNNQDNKIRELAALKLVAIKISENNIDSAKTLLQEIISNKDYQNLTISYAKIIWLSLMLDRTGLSAEEVEQVQNYLQYFENDNQEFYGIANLMKAIWYDKKGQTSLALDALKNIRSCQTLPVIINEQAKALMTTIEMRSK